MFKVVDQFNFTFVNIFNKMLKISCVHDCNVEYCVTN